MPRYYAPPQHPDEVPTPPNTPPRFSLIRSPESLLIATRSPRTDLRLTACEFMGYDNVPTLARKAREGYQFCTTCWNEKRLNEFYPDKRLAIGVRCTCKECDNGERNGRRKRRIMRLMQLSA